VPGVLHLRGTVVLDDHREVGDVWVVGDRLTLERPAATPDATIDGWVLPGLVDVHCHIGLAADGPVDDATAEKQAVADRDSGVLLVRDAGSPADTRWVHARPDLPRLIRAGHHLARPKRYLRHYGRELASVDDLPTAVREEALLGDGWVKLVADWIDRDLGPDGDLRPLWPDDVLRRAVAVAHDEGARVTAHTFATEAVDPLLDAGVPVLVGTDAGGTIGHGNLADEAAEMVRAGIPARDVVAAASWRTRAWLGADGIAEGASADVVVYDRDPRVDVEALREPVAVILRGERWR
jgi:imidazolonepropionase-like amidohydrolase